MGCLVAVAVVGAIMLLSGGALGVYLFGIADGVMATGTKVPSIAHRHLPDDCEAVIRVDVASVLGHEAVRKHVIPAIEEGGETDDDARAFSQFLKHALIDPKKDITEVVVCLTDVSRGARLDYVAVIGGEFVPGVVLPALRRHSKSSEVKTIRTVDQVQILEAADEPMVFGQAVDDGALFVANTVARVQAAGSEGAAYERYALPLHEDAAAHVAADAVRAFAESSESNPLVTRLQNAGPLRLHASLSSTKLEASQTMPDAESAKKLARVLARVLEGARKDPPSDGSLGPIGAQALDSAKVATAGKDVVVTVTLPDDAIEELAKEAAKAIRQAQEEGL